MIGNASLPRRPLLPIRRRIEQKGLLDWNLSAALVDDVQPLGGRVEDDAEIGSDRGHELLHLADRFTKQCRSGVGAVGGEAMRGHGFNTEWPEQERQDERRSREAVVDDEPEAPRANRLDVEVVEQVLRVGLPHSRRIADRADVARSRRGEALHA